ncbi:MAG: Rieske 2Fe-2S domain-containing protein [Candidatus Bathyarchaeota archaeon]|nr:Rieske 2Fe-2S domain-containing protein [Candidatus Bathyarchaeota archaeon]
MGWVDVANTKDIGKGKMKLIGSEGKKYVVANVNGKFYAFNDRCPHMNAPLHLGVLEGKIIECPLCRARYDVTLGKKLSDPKMDMTEGIKKKLPADFLKMYRKINEMMNHIETLDLHTYETKIKSGKVFIKLSPSEMFKPPPPMVHPPPEELAEMFEAAAPACHSPSHEHAEKVKPSPPMRHSPSKSDFSVSRKTTHTHARKPTAKYCWNCGNSILEGVRFCDKCGSSQIQNPTLISAVF